MTSPLGLVRLAFSRRVCAGEDLATGSWRLVAAWRPLSLVWVALGLALCAGVLVVGVDVPELLAAGAPAPLEPPDVAAPELRWGRGAGAGPGAGGVAAWPEPALPGLGGTPGGELA